MASFRYIVSTSNVIRTHLYNNIEHPKWGLLSLFAVNHTHKNFIEINFQGCFKNLCSPSIMHNTHISSVTLKSPSIIHISTITYRTGLGASVRVNFDFWCTSENLIPSGQFVYLRTCWPAVWMLRLPSCGRRSRIIFCIYPTFCLPNRRWMFHYFVLGRPSPFSPTQLLSCVVAANMQIHEIKM